MKCASFHGFVVRSFPRHGRGSSREPVDRHYFPQGTREQVPRDSKVEMPLPHGSPVVRSETHLSVSCGKELLAKLVGCEEVDVVGIVVRCLNVRVRGDDEEESTRP